MWSHLGWSTNGNAGFVSDPGGSSFTWAQASMLSTVKAAALCLPHILTECQCTTGAGAHCPTVEQQQTSQPGHRHQKFGSSSRGDKSNSAKLHDNEWDNYVEVGIASSVRKQAIWVGGWRFLKLHEWFALDEHSREPIQTPPDLPHGPRQRKWKKITPTLMMTDSSLSSKICDIDRPTE